MRERIWSELGQAKHNHFYSCFLLARQRRWLNYYNMTILAFSSGGVMGWAIWKNLPLLSCIIVATISLAKLLSPHIMPSEKQIDKLDQISDFYFDYYNKIEQIWYDHYNDRITDEQAQARFYEIKNTERDIGKIVNEIVKSINKRIYIRADQETRNYLSNNFNV
ncbi:hypothetical protein [Paraflavitalea sp. CAU 1676]|uniref:hypothetical protein n=1 Tax=Paraflavitalea sp. CAU 1676 TaxID=3032598 RepID=UPI0023DADA2C|nr:hypothetical protein [Paraflavitalea sp. CAU 1676]MDF2192609.1 hypothetical protein [Paraflavitalea sp. CAU 1676]